MTVSYWIAGPVQYRLVRELKPGLTLLDCVAPFTPVKLVREYTP